MTDQTSPVTERAAFEDWWMGRGKTKPSRSTEPGYEDQYAMANAEMAWRGWQAARGVAQCSRVQEAQALADCAEGCLNCRNSAYPSDVLRECIKFLRGTCANSSTDRAKDDDIQALNEEIERMRAAISSPVRCQVCGETAELKCGPSRFGDKTWACKDCWEPESSPVRPNISNGAHDSADMTGAITRPDRKSEL